MKSPRQPTYFLPHGGGPCFWIESPPPFGPHAWDGLRAFLAGLVDSLPAPPKAFVVVTAHWETETPTVSACAAPGMLYDYYNFPKHTYELKYPAPGEPELAARVKNLVAGAGLPIETDDGRGFDHGVFVPFLIVDPDAKIPVVMMSLQRELDPALHLAIGAALAPLRDEGVVIVGSGRSFHDLRHFRDGDGRASEAFDAWLAESATARDANIRADRLVHWAEAPFARACHPREEHLLPLMVAAGAAGESRGTVAFRDVIGGKTISGYRFG
jgi:aromatic ring-opening dioxygenase catalytic subunit (LigB family)